METNKAESAMRIKVKTTISPLSRTTRIALVNGRKFRLMRFTSSDVDHRSHHRSRSIGTEWVITERDRLSIVA